VSQRGERPSIWSLSLGYKEQAGTGARETRSPEQSEEVKEQSLALQSSLSRFQLFCHQSFLKIGLNLNPWCGSTVGLQYQILNTLLPIHVVVRVCVCMCVCVYVCVCVCMCVCVCVCMCVCVCTSIYACVSVLVYGVCVHCKKVAEHAVEISFKQQTFRETWLNFLSWKFYACIASNFVFIYRGVHPKRETEFLYETFAFGPY